ncbi:MAG: beta-galactosidase [Oscillibacter sp.]|nr:beta-galactosidase [Oscillibacter sp.]
MWLGVDYYPEQWPRELLESDLDTIKELGCNIIRIAEFAWHIMEPDEGQYDFSYFDEVIAQAKKRDLKIMMGTPTAAIPAWLARKHPEILSVSETGQTHSYGGRHTACYNSPILRAYAEKIIRAQAEHYKNESQIVAWQIDNELGHEGSDLCLCPACRKGFHAYLRARYGGIDDLNETWGTVFWSQQYNRFEEIPLPLPTVTTHNPSLRLDWERYRAQVLTDFAAFQADLIRSIIPNAQILHDFPGGGIEKHADYSQIARHLDVAAYNNYPVWGGQKEPLPPHEIAFGLDYIRGLKRRNFWITEAIMGAQGHDVTGYLPRPNQAKLWSCQAMAHGCESLLYFRYRGATKGAEQFCYGVIDADNRRGRRFQEVQDFFADIRQYEAPLSTPIQAPAAILYNYESLASFRIQRQSLLLDPPGEMKKLYKAFYDVNVPTDILPDTSDLDAYKIVLLPQMAIVKPELIQRLQVFAEKGGTVILTYRTAVKDEYNNLVLNEPLPVGLTKLAGITVAETESLQDLAAFPVRGTGPHDGASAHGGIFRDMLVPEEGTEVLFRYADTFYKDYAAVTRKPCGAGAVYYLGTALDEATTASLLQSVMLSQGIPLRITPPGVEIIDRGETERIRIYLNHNGEPTQAEGEELPAYGCKIERI